MATTWVTLARTPNERHSAELALVLAASAIEHRRVHGPYGVELQVPEDDYRRALAEIDGYERENERRRPPPAPVEIIGHGWPGVCAYVALLMLVTLCLDQGAFGGDWLAAGRLDAGALTGDGEWWRAVTALTLHADLRHMFGNLAFGSFFGYFAARHMGSGLAWAAILAAGVLGNALNAVLSGPDHLSIGASTAVFAALGLLSAFTWRRTLAEGMSMRARAAPLFAGVALLAWTGVGGENTDVGAHVAGFAVGASIGAALAHADLRTGPRAQLAFGLGAAALVVTAWLAAFAAA